MQRVKRTAISLKPKQPYLDWANSLDEDSVKIGTAFVPEENIYLIADSVDQQENLEALLEPYDEAIFEEELEAWHRVEADWPRRVTCQRSWPGLRWKCTAWCSTWSAAGYAVSAMTDLSEMAQAARR